MFKFLAVLLFASQVLASCTCGTVTYTDKDISSARDKGQSVNAGPTSFGGSYPHRFGNRERIDFPKCKGNEYVEYPLKQGEPYTGGPPGADRVVYLRDGGSLCGCMTHRGARGNNFVACT